MSVLADTPTLGLLIGLPAALLILAASLAAIYVSRRVAEDRHYGAEEDARILKWGGVGCAVLTVVISLAAFWPLKHDYHFYVDKGGKVEKVAKRIISDGDGGISERYVLTIDGQPYGVDDTRAANVQPGDVVSIGCKKEYQWGSTNHGWACRWNGSEETGTR